jgi:hypothetical protein
MTNVIISAAVATITQCAGRRPRAMVSFAYSTRQGSILVVRPYQPNSMTAVATPDTASRPLYSAAVEVILRSCRHVSGTARQSISRPAGKFPSREPHRIKPARHEERHQHSRLQRQEPASPIPPWYVHRCRFVSLAVRQNGPESQVKELPSASITAKTLRDPAKTISMSAVVAERWRRSPDVSRFATAARNIRRRMAYPL